MLDAFEEEEIGWFWATDSDNRLIYLSPSAAQRFAADRPVLGQALGTVVEAVPGEGEERSERPLSFLLSARNKFADLTVRVETRDGEMFWSLTGKPHFDAQRRLPGLSRQRQGHHRRIRAASATPRGWREYDSLTGLANRHRMAKRLDRDPRPPTSRPSAAAR